MAQIHHPKATPKRPLGEPTRGKTARNRLRRVDNFLAMYDPRLIRRNDGEFAQAWFVDLGYGSEPWTALESAERLRKLNPRLPVLGVEIDPERVAAAQPYADALTQFRLGGFNVPLQSLATGRVETARAIRAFNVLRQYNETAVADAWAQMMKCLLPGGLLIEGTSDPLGRIWVANVLRKGERELGSRGDRESSTTNDHLPPATCHLLVFSSNFRTGFDPGEFQERLPKNLIHHMVEGEWIFDFFAAWKRAAAATTAYKTFGLRQWFAAAALQLAEQGYVVDTRRKWIANGYLLLSLTP
ncbi:MAG: hypothetical protein U0175_17165 [Caldilineaceae bacterium]